MTEHDLQEAVIACAHVFGWRVAHFRTSRTKHGWATAVAADGKGFPDLVLVRGERLLFVELKAEKGKLTPEQEQWNEALSGPAAASRGHVAGFLWRPEDWLLGRIEKVLA